MFHNLFNWIQNVPGATDGDPYTSWSQQLAGSLHLWALLEGTHVLTLMLFAGTILMVDMRMLGVAFRSVPFSSLNNKVLPITVVGFVLLILTGVLLFLADPVRYYHSFWFRAKLIFLLVALANIFWFHYRIQKNQGDWDAMPSAPRSVKLAAAISLSSWILVIAFGRLIAFGWFDCDKLPETSFGYAFAECASLWGEPMSLNELESGRADISEAPSSGPLPDALPPVDPGSPQLTDEG